MVRNARGHMSWETIHPHLCARDRFPHSPEWRWLGTEMIGVRVHSHSFKKFHLIEWEKVPPLPWLAGPLRQPKVMTKTMQWKTTRWSIVWWECIQPQWLILFCSSEHSNFMIWMRRTSDLLSIKLIWIQRKQLFWHPQIAVFRTFLIGFSQFNLSDTSFGSSNCAFLTCFAHMPCHCWVVHVAWWKRLGQGLSSRAMCERHTWPRAHAFLCVRYST